MNRVRFVIEGRPVPKGRGRSIPGTNRVVTPKKTVRAEKTVASLARAAMGSRNPMTGPVRLNIVFVFAIPQGWNRAMKQAAMEGRVWHVGPIDTDNMTKMVSDACNEIVFADDGQVAVITVGKRYGAPERTEVTITELEQADDAITPGQRKLADDMASGRWHIAKAEKAARKRLRN